MAQIAKLSNICIKCKALLNQCSRQILKINKSFYVTSGVKYSNDEGSNRYLKDAQDALIEKKPRKDFIPETPQHRETLPTVKKQESSAIVRPPLPLITSRKLEHPTKYLTPKQAWLESLSTIEDEKLGIIDLHPDIFGTYPRIDILHNNIRWQQTFRRISYAKTKSRAEVRGGGRKPWRQKGTGKARHGSIRSPIWLGGGRAFGPRGPKSYFYMLPVPQRVLGLRVALSVKLAQNDLHIVDSLDIPTTDPQYMMDLIDTRFWGFSVLFVDDKEMMPENISVALNEIEHFNLMPVLGLNVYSMLKHETLVLTLAAVEKLEQRLLYQMHKTTRQMKYRFADRHLLVA